MSCCFSLCGCGECGFDFAIVCPTDKTMNLAVHFNACLALRVCNDCFISLAIFLRNFQASLGVSWPFQWAL